MYLSSTQGKYLQYICVYMLEEFIKAYDKREAPSLQFRNNFEIKCSYNLRGFKWNSILNSKELYLTNIMIKYSDDEEKTTFLTLENNNPYYNIVYFLDKDIDLKKKLSEYRANLYEKLYLHIKNTAYYINANLIDLNYFDLFSLLDKMKFRDKNRKKIYKYNIIAFYNEILQVNNLNLSLNDYNIGQLVNKLKQSIDLLETCTVDDLLKYDKKKYFNEDTAILGLEVLIPKYKELIDEEIRNYYAFYSKILSIEERDTPF